MPASLKYNPALDGIRALAITEVVVRHAFSSADPGWGIGVEVFFTLSGYLITRILLEQMEAGGSLKQFYANRALRLMPPLWALLLALLVPFLLSHQWKSLMEAWAMAAAYLMNFNRAFAWWPQTYLGHIWSLAEQEQFYLIWPPVLLLIGRRHMGRVILVLLAAAFLWRFYLLTHGATFARVYNGLDTHLDSILVGGGLALISVPAPVKRVLCGAWFAWPALLVVSSFLFPYASRTVQLFGSPLAGLIAACLIVATEHPGLQKMLAAGPLIFIGRISYGLYLWHYPLIEIAVRKYGLTGIALLAPIAVAGLLATLSYFTIEAYARRFKQRLAARTRILAPEYPLPVLERIS